MSEKLSRGRVVSGTRDHINGALAGGSLNFERFERKPGLFGLHRIHGADSCFLFLQDNKVS